MGKTDTTDDKSKTKKKSSTMNSRYSVPKKQFKRRKGESSNTTYARERSFYTDESKGGRGVCVKFSRMMRHCRCVRKEFPESFKALLVHNKARKQPFSQSFGQVAIGGLDALANQVMQTARTFAEARTGIDDPNKGLNLSKNDMKRAIETVKKFSH